MAIDVAVELLRRKREHPHYLGNGAGGFGALVQPLYRFESLAVVLIYRPSMLLNLKLSISCNKTMGATQMIIFVILLYTGRSGLLCD
jgi:hypothetical protein